MDDELQTELRKLYASELSTLHRMYDECRAEGPDGLRDRQQRLLLAWLKEQPSRRRIALGEAFLSVANDRFRAPMPAEVTG